MAARLSFGSVFYRVFHNHVAQAFRPAPPGGREGRLLHQREEHFSVFVRRPEAAEHAEDDLGLAPLQALRALWRWALASFHVEHSPVDAEEGGRRVSKLNGDDGGETGRIGGRIV